MVNSHGAMKSTCIVVFTLNLVQEGNNNPWGGPAFATVYANGSYNLRNGLSLGVAVENLLQYSSGPFHGQAIVNKGFSPTGVAWNRNCLLNGNPFTNPNSIVIVQPRNVYVTLTEKL